MSSCTSGCPPAVAAALGRHADRRRSGLPTVSVLVGPTALAALMWRRWTSAAHLVPLSYNTAEPEVLVRHLVADMAAVHRLPELALNYLLRMAGRPESAPATDLSNQTILALDRLADSAVADLDDQDTVRVSHELCRLELAGSRCAEHLAGRLVAVLGNGDGRPWWGVLRVLNELLPPDGRPAILLTPPPAAHAVVWLAEAAGHLSRLAESVPGWPAGVAVPREALQRYVREALESRAKSLLLAGEVPIPVVDQHELVERLRSVAVNPDDMAESVRRLAAVGASESLADAFTNAARLRPRRDDAARSAAERFLFELLESHPATSGRFVLNGSPGFAFGPRAAEVDLLAAGLRLALEVDGYYHFTEPAAYRRDRRKDWELQRHGYRVVRVLADDVVTHMEDVLDLVLSAVDHCDRRSKGEAKP